MAPSELRKENLHELQRQLGFEPDSDSNTETDSHFPSDWTTTSELIARAASRPPLQCHLPPFLRTDLSKVGDCSLGAWWLEEGNRKPPPQYFYYGPAKPKVRKSICVKREEEEAEEARRRRRIRALARPRRRLSQNSTPQSSSGGGGNSSGMIRVRRSLRIAWKEAAESDARAAAGESREKKVFSRAAARAEHAAMRKALFLEKSRGQPSLGVVWIKISPLDPGS
ncbi:hypothetical protein F4679DRAFT_562339 [Xylaria curta]|nr:hypothetical protein F4679DRAFT_562339 [Xylaria curta]